MSVDICCVVNAHREGSVLYPTILSVKRAVRYAQKCGLTAEIHIILDNSDQATREIVFRECTDDVVIHEVMFKDLAHSRNYAVEKSTGRYMAFVDGDDLWSRTWLVDAYVKAERAESTVVLHPEYNIFFGDSNNHVFNHVDMDDSDFELESIYRMNYWTALSFARTETYLKHPYRKNTIMDGFGYEDWTWNYETIQDGIKHKVVAGTVHFIRKGRDQDSLLAQTNVVNAVPRILDIYRVPEVLENETSKSHAALAEAVNQKLAEVTLDSATENEIQREELVNDHAIQRSDSADVFEPDAKVEHNAEKQPEDNSDDMVPSNFKLVG